MRGTTRAIASLAIVLATPAIAYGLLRTVHAIVGDQAADRWGIVEAEIGIVIPWAVMVMPHGLPLAAVQWALVAALIAWLTRERRFGWQLLASFGAVLLVGAGVFVLELSLWGDPLVIEF